MMELWFLAALVVAGAVAYSMHNVISSLMLHPLANIPGPKYAAITGYYQFYYDVIRRGRFPWKLKLLHQKYGAVQRCSIDNSGN